MNYLCAISKNFVEQFWRIRFPKVCITIAMFKLALAINFLIMLVAPPFEQTLITHNQGLFICNIQEFCLILEKKIFKGCIKFSMFKLSLAITLPTI